MKICELQTPATLVDLDSLENNIKRYQAACDKYGKEMWPMIKTHKSTEMVKMQLDAGAKGFLCGTLDECEAVANMGIQNIMYAYPVASPVSAARVAALAKKCSNFIIRIDDLTGAKVLDDTAAKEGVKIQYTIIINSGLGRFGVLPSEAGDFAKKLQAFSNLTFKGISTHPGHVYAAEKAEDIQKYVDDEKNSVKTAVESLKAAGFTPEMVSSGSTPTFFAAVSDEYITAYHPGNYVFNDNIQMSTKTATEAECALRIFATVVSHPQDDLFICDAGAKCLGLDQGAHGNSSIRGYGYVVGHPELEVFSLSEEVGKFHVHGTTDLKVGDQVEIIPNHSCSSANLTSYMIGCRNGEVERVIEVDIRGNSTRKNA